MISETGKNTAVNAEYVNTGMFAADAEHERIILVAIISKKNQTVFMCRKEQGNNSAISGKLSSGRMNSW